MELLLFRPRDFEAMYNCTNFDADRIPHEHRIHLGHGCVLIALFVILEILYVPCMMSIHRHMAANPCYKLLFVIGIIDMLTMLMTGLETGILGIMGVVCCDYPILIYTTGFMGLSLWLAETTTELLLAINRCMELMAPKLAHTIYHGNRTWYLCTIPVVYSLMVGFYTAPFLFSGLYFSWFFNPYVGYSDDFGQIYHNKFHTVHDLFVIFGLSAIYLTFSGMLLWRTYSLTSADQSYKPTWTQKMTFLQVVIISVFNAVASAIYIFMQYVRISNSLIIIGMYAWFFAHGSPPAIYLLLNQSIRKDCARSGRALFKRRIAPAVSVVKFVWANRSRPSDAQQPM